jgi:MFS family permease
MTISTLPAARPFYGWHIVAATFLLAVFGWGVGFYGPPVFLYAVVARTGWPVALVSAAVTVHFLIGALVVANLPRLYRRIGVPQVTTLGAATLALGILGWAFADQRWHLFVAAAASGAGWVAMGAAAVNALIAPWFSQRRPAALGMAYNGASLGGVIFSPLWIVLIGALGFGTAALAVGGTMVVVVALLSLCVFSHTPDSLGQAPDGRAVPEVAHSDDAKVVPPRRSLWRDRQFLTLAAGMMLGLFAQIGLLAHLFSLLVPVIGEKTTGLAMGGATVAAIIGRSAVGWLMPASADRRLVACLSYGLQLVGSVLLIASLSDGSLWLILGLMLFGLGIGNATSLPPLIAQNEFAPSETMRIVPLIVAIGQAGYAFAPISFGLLREGAAGQHPEAHNAALFAAAAVVQLAAIICFLAGRRHDPSDHREAFV